MALTLIVEDGSVVANANSYISLAEADAYIEANAHANADWSALTDDEKTALLIWATRYIDIRVQWEGVKVDSDAVLSWPREGAYDHEGTAILSTEIPVRLKFAVAEMARFLIDTDRSAPGLREGISRIRVDVVEIYMDADYRQMTIPNDVMLLLAALGSIQNPSGITFGKIKRA